MHRKMYIEIFALNFKKVSCYSFVMDYELNYICLKIWFNMLYPIRNNILMIHIMYQSQPMIQKVWNDTEGF